MSRDKNITTLNSFINLVTKRDSAIECTGLSGSEKAYLVSKICDKIKTPLCIVTPSKKEAQKFIEDLSFYLKEHKDRIIFFPPYNILPFKNLSYHNETAAARISALYTLASREISPVVVTTVDALIQKIIPKQKLVNYAELIMAGEDIDRDQLIKKLNSGGYEHTIIVEEPGDFSVRGGIIDVFSPLYPDPLRIEFFGNTVDSLRLFSAVSQKKLKNISEAIILPAKEAILQKERIDSLINRIRKQAAAIGIPYSTTREIIEQIKKEGAFSGIEGMISIIYKKPDTLFDYVPENTLFVLTEPDQSKKATEDTFELASKSFFNARNENRLCVEPDAVYLKWENAYEILLQKKPLLLKMLRVFNVKEKDNHFLQIDFDVYDNTELTAKLKNFRGKENLLSPFADWIDDKRKKELATILVCSTKSQAERLKDLLLPYSIHAKMIENFPDTKHAKGIVYVCLGHISSGFVWPAESLSIITEDEIFGAKHRRKRSKQKVKTKLIEFGDLKKDDLVVHIEHGIGRYEGMVKLSLNGATNDFLLIIFRDGDKLYLPVDRMSVISKYMGIEGYQPVLDKMGGKSWERVKRKVKKSVEKIAGKLLKLYAERKVKKGHAFSKPDSYFKDFEASFPYEETKDQLKAIDDVLDDMERQTPMDRLICGDVGYGKTEVAVRASFKAVSDSKQVAVLVPTTILAEQHFKTFSERYYNYPVNIECLSRFRSKKKQHEIINNLKSGKIDIIIGTHRLIQKDVEFKDLGLLVLDEEQRFGVKHKEKLKKLKSTVDVLTLTATPIPRTLHMSLIGARDISVISTPPEHRHSIVTYVCKLDEEIISDAITKELKRGGQIFFVHNNIHSIWAMAKKLKELVPKVKLDVAHGRLSEKELEDVMIRFINREIDMLVCTTIVESGLDIPSVNTILINRADRFGLAQMYQLRGRVGRADEQAYAYLFIPDESVLSKDAQKRLKVLMEHSDLGSGFQIAMNDLKIRGGGTILGASQSGHIAAVGYDMFLKLMEKSISELKGEPVAEELDPEINVPISCYLPEAYIPDIDQRLSVYRRLAKMTQIEELSDMKEELSDRFGKLPVEAANLILKIMLKILSAKAGVKKLDLAGDKLSVSFSEMHQKYPHKILDMIETDKNRFRLTPDYVLQAELSKGNTISIMSQAKNILKEIALHVSN